MTKQIEQIVQAIDYRFIVSGHLIKKLGEESIANKNIAILELIKNAYDARATKVEVKLQSIGSTNDAKIIIEDNGDGMSNSDLVNNWFNIATPNKSQKIIKPGDRIPVGEKGIGRLSSESLGEQTVLITRPKAEIFGYKVTLDWTQYQNKSVLVNEVINSGFKFKKIKAENGTVLEISKLKHDWNDLESQKKLLKDIYLLHPPNAKPKNFLAKASFSISDLKKLDSKFLKNAAYHLKVSFRSNNLINYECKAVNGKSKKGQIKLEKKLICGDADFELFYFYRTANALKSALEFVTNSEKIKEANDILDEYSGIKLYRDSFRVKPYGEDNNDWLGLELDYQNNTMFPRNINIFGFVHISKDKNPKIADTTTREGVIFTDEFQDLIRLVRTSIKEAFVVFRSEVESHKKKAKKTAAKKISKPKKVTPVSAKASASITSDKIIKDLGSAYPQSFYTILEQEINDCYKSNYPNAAFFLSRKLVENLVFNILEKKYPTNIALWYSTITKSHLKFSLLISNLFDNKADFKSNVQSYIEKFNTQVGPFRKEANSKAHNIYEYLKDKSELSKFKINDLIQLLLNIYHNI